ncbi:hypothetical protein Avbf_03352 [Armadillidium vulgare]|nr:hypothetical protein Avbf_03352 [Armadillidium vulgare]
MKQRKQKGMGLGGVWPKGGGGGSEYPYLREMKERLLIAKDAPLNTVEDPTQMDPENQLLEVHQTPVGTVVKVICLFY